MKLIYTFNGYQDVIIKDLTLNIGQRRLNDKRWFMYHYPISWEWGLVKLVISSILLKFKNYSKSIHTHTHTHTEVQFKNRNLGMRGGEGRDHSTLLSFLNFASIAEFLPSVFSFK